jgi:membrane protein YdbS with pleckstrin-like domain
MGVKSMAVPSGGPVTVHRGSFPTRHLIPGERILWEGRPSRIVYFVRSMLMFIFGLAFSALAWGLHRGDLHTDDPVTFVPLIVMLALMGPMVLLDRRWGIVETIAGLAVIGAVLAFDDITRWITLVPAVIGLAFFLFDYIVWSHPYFAISDRRIMTQYGIFNLMFVDTQIDRIQNVTVVQPLLERIFGYGDVMFTTAGSMGGIRSDDPAEGMRKGGALVWENIPRPFEVRRIAEDIINRATAPPAYVAAPAYVPPVAAPASPPAPAAPISSFEAEERLTKLKELNERGLISDQEYAQKRKEILGQM